MRTLLLQKNFPVTPQIFLNTNYVLNHRTQAQHSIQEEDITLANIYAPEYIKQIPTDVKGETDNTTIIVRL